MAWASGRLWLQPEGNIGPSAQPALRTGILSLAEDCRTVRRILVRGLAAEIDGAPP